MSDCHSQGQSSSFSYTANPEPQCWLQKKEPLQKTKMMNTNAKQSPPAASNNAAIKKSTPMAMAGASFTKVAKPATTTPSQELIAKKAYEMWLAQGQQPGSEQRNWFEAELQLQHRTVRP